MTRRSEPLVLFIASLNLFLVGLVSADDKQPAKTGQSGNSISGCMTTACHGANSASDAPLWQRAGSIWFDQDPHAQAYTSLQTELSKNIVWRMTKREMAVGSIDYKAFLEIKCVSCHASELAPVSKRNLGGDCQICHGPADAWDDTHFSQEWQSLGVKRFEDRKMVNVESIALRAAVCSSCHVGELSRIAGRDREVDHQLMASGHPPMYFDFELFSRRYPKHWETNDELAQYSKSSRLRSWRIGKLQASIARTKMLTARAEKAQQSDSSHDWPELTEYSCTNCHHALEQPSWRQAKGANASYLWDSWCTSLLSQAIGENSSVALSNQLEELTKEMERIAPSAYAVQSKSERVLNLLESELKSVIDTNHWPDADLTSQLAELLKLEPTLSSWESAAQWYILTESIADGLNMDASKKRFSKLTKQGFFGEPKTWLRNDESTRPNSSDFRPGFLSDYSDTLFQELRSRELRSRP